MEIGIKVGDIMTRNFVSVKPDTSLMECARVMIKNRVGSLILKEADKFFGLLTERNVVWALTKKSSFDLKKIKARDIANTKVPTIKPSSDLYQALHRMKKAGSGCRWLPVIVNGKVIGLLTIKDILRIEPSLFDVALESMQIREEAEKLKRRQLAKEPGSKSVKNGMCEECGNVGSLFLTNGMLVCQDCREEM